MKENIYEKVSQLLLDRTCESMGNVETCMFLLKNNVNESELLLLGFDNLDIKNAKAKAQFIDLNPNNLIYKRERQGYNDGFIFKSVYNFYKGEGVCYIPEYIMGVDDYETYVSGEHGYTRQDFDKLCEGTRIDPEYLFELVDWQHPETLLDELLENDDDDDF